MTNPLEGVPNGIYTDHLIVTPDEALEACVHHLRLAGMFFMSSPNDGLPEAKRLLLSRAGILGEEDPVFIAACAFLAQIAELTKAPEED